MAVAYRKEHFAISRSSIAKMIIILLTHHLPHLFKRMSSQKVALCFYFPVNYFRQQPIDGLTYVIKLMEYIDVYIS